MHFGINAFGLAGWSANGVYQWIDFQTLKWPFTYVVSSLHRCNLRVVFTILIFRDIFCFHFYL